MENRLEKLIGELELNPGAPQELLMEVQFTLGVTFPDQYLLFMSKSNGAEGPLGKGYLALWTAEELAPLNEGYAVSQFAPGLLLFGSSRGGMAYGFNTSLKQMPIVAVPFVGMSWADAEPCGDTFVEFLEYVHCGGETA